MDSAERCLRILAGQYPDVKAWRKPTSARLFQAIRCIGTRPARHSAAAALVLKEFFTSAFDEIHVLFRQAKLYFVYCHD
jgi:hypothetical protein